MSTKDNSQNDVRSLLTAGLVHEKAGEWETALAYWLDCSEQWPDEITFYLRQIGASLRTEKPEVAMSSLKNARRLDVDKDHSAALDGLQARAEKLQASLYRIRGHEAFEAGDFEVARQNFEDLSEVVPDHPWAAARARVAAGLSPLFSQRLRDALPLVRDRVFLTGCGRSGTWLLTAMLNCIPDIRNAERETPLGAFLEMPNEPMIHLVKRPHDAYKHFDKIPPEIKVIHVVRHPFDVLCSRHRETERFISLERLEAEHAAYFAHLENRPNTLTVKYEDIVRHPDLVQKAVESVLNVRSALPFQDFYRNADMADYIVEAMHGLRPLDATSLHAWRGKDDDKSYLREQVTQSDGTLEKFAAAFDYDLTIAI